MVIKLDIDLLESSSSFAKMMVLSEALLAFDVGLKVAKSSLKVTIWRMSKSFEESFK